MRTKLTICGVVLLIVSFVTAICVTVIREKDNGSEEREAVASLANNLEDELGPSSTKTASSISNEIKITITTKEAQESRESDAPSFRLSDFASSDMPSDMSSDFATSDMPSDESSSTEIPMTDLTDPFLGDSDENNASPIDVYTKDSISIAYFGDSNTFANNCPLLLDKMLKMEFPTVQYVQCLEEGSNLQSLTFSTCPDWFNTDGSPNPQNWDFVVLQDQSRWSADLDTRSFSIGSLERSYAPMLFGNDVQMTMNKTLSEQYPIPVLGQTPAYKEFGLFGTESLGDFDSFTNLVAEGYQAYADALDKEAALASGMTDLKISRIAANGEAYRWLYHNYQELWAKLYMPDNFRPSEYGTWLLACTLYITMTGKEPPIYDPIAWGWQSSDIFATPTEGEAELLRLVALYTMGLSEQPPEVPTKPPSPITTKPVGNPTVSLPGNFDNYDVTPPDVYTKDSIKIAYFGNSYTTRNDCPAVVDQMLKLDYTTVENVQCVQGGNRLDGLAQGRCPDWFETDGSPNPQKWDFVILQDQSNYPVYLDTREVSLASLSNRYAPLLFGTTPGSEQTDENIYEQFPIPILMQTPAYKFGLPGLGGGFEGMSDQLLEAYQAYADILDLEAAQAANINNFQISRIAPNGEAYRWLYYNMPELWAKLYDPDNSHPSVHGTWLLACILYVSMTGREPPTFNFEWFGWNPEVIPGEEAEILRNVAARIMGL